MPLRSKPPPAAVQLKTATISAVCFAVGLLPLGLSNYLLFHAIAETFSVVVSTAIFTLAWSSRRRLPDAFLVVVGVASLYVGIADLFHMLSYAGMGVFESAGPGLSTQLWIIARSIQAAGLLLGVLAAGKVIDSRIPLIGFGIVATGALLSVAYGIFPECYVVGSGLTPFKIWMELLIGIIFIVSTVLVWKRRSHFETHVLWLLMGSSLLMVVSELAFTQYVGLFGLANILGHIAKVASYIFLYLALVETGFSAPLRLLFRNAERQRLMVSDASLMAGFGAYDWQAGTTEVVLSPELAQVLELPTSVPLADLAEYAEDPDHRAAADCVAEAVEQGTTFNCEITNVVDGERHVFHIQGRVEEDNAGHVARVFGWVLDITERRKAETLREDVERMMRHDLKTPLTTLVTLPELLLERGGLAEDQRELLDLMRTDALRMQSMLRRFMDVYRMEQGHYHLHPTEVDMVALSEGLIRALEKKTQEHQVTINLLTEGSELVVYGEELLCYNMLGALLENAIEASQAGDAVKLRLKPINQHLEIEVWNRAVVPDEVKDRFFQKYFTSGKRGGNGLGTHIARLSALTQQGSISLKSADGRGTSVIVRLPSTPAALAVAKR